MPESFAPPLPQVDEASGEHLGSYVLDSLADLSPDTAATFKSAGKGKKSGGDLVDACEAILMDLDNSPEKIEALRNLGAAFTAAREFDHPPPEGVTQTYWNRQLRDQGERLRAASMTLAAGQAEVASMQLAQVRSFLAQHILDLPE